jgi:hypothetical protein
VPMRIKQLRFRSMPSNSSDRKPNIGAERRFEVRRYTNSRN